MSVKEAHLAAGCNQVAGLNLEEFLSSRNKLYGWVVYSTNLAKIIKQVNQKNKRNKRNKKKKKTNGF